MSITEATLITQKLITLVMWGIVPYHRRRINND